MSRKKSNAVHDETFISNRRTKINVAETKTIEFIKKQPTKPINLTPKTLNQEKYILALTDTSVDVVIVSGPAGTGKTYLALNAAIKAFRNRECDKIILCRPAVSVENENHGFLPGDLNAKLEPWVRPMLDVLREFYNTKELESMIADHVIEFSPLGFMRGRTFKNAWIILDEGQNANPSMMKMLLTRIGTGSKIVITGDTEQADRRDPDNGLLDLVQRLRKTEIRGISTCEFEVKDIQRHRLIGEVLRLYS